MTVSELKYWGQGGEWFGVQVSKSGENVEQPRDNKTRETEGGRLINMNSAELKLLMKV